MADLVMPDIETALLDAARAVAIRRSSSTARQRGMRRRTSSRPGCRVADVERVTIVESATSGGRTLLTHWLQPDAMATFALAGAAVAGQSETDEQLALALVGEDGIEAARDRARRIVDEHSDAIAKVADALLSARTLERDALEELRLQLGPPDGREARKRPCS